MRRPTLDERWEQTPGGVYRPRRSPTPRRFLQKMGAAKECCATTPIVPANCSDCTSLFDDYYDLTIYGSGMPTLTYRAGPGTETCVATGPGTTSTFCIWPTSYIYGGAMRLCFILWHYKNNSTGVATITARAAWKSTGGCLMLGIYNAASSAVDACPSAEVEGTYTGTSVPYQYCDIDYVPP